LWASTAITTSICFLLGNAGHGYVATDFANF